MAKIQMTLMGVNISQEPELQYTQTGKAKLQFTVLSDPPKWITNPEKQGPTSWRVTFWGTRAVFWHSLFSEFKNPRSGKVGVGLNLNVMVTQVPYVSKWLDKSTGEPRSTIELTAYDLEINSRLPDDAYKRAGVAQRAAGQPDGDEGWGDDTGTGSSDIPF